MANIIIELIIAVLLLLIISQLRAIKKSILTQTSSPSTTNDAALSMEAYLMELESKGANILARIEGEKASLNMLAEKIAQAATGTVAKVDQPLEPNPVVEEWVRPSVVGKRNEQGELSNQTLQQAVRSMAKRGEQPAVIARTLGLGKEEVRLILKKRVEG